MISILPNLKILRFHHRIQVYRTVNVGVNLSSCFLPVYLNLQLVESDVQQDQTINPLVKRIGDTSDLLRYRAVDKSLAFQRISKIRTSRLSGFPIFSRADVEYCFHV